MTLILTVSLLIFWKITQTYKHTPPPPHPLPPPPFPPKEREGLAPPPFGGEGEGVGWGGGGGGVCLYVCVMFRNINREVEGSRYFFNR